MSCVERIYFKFNPGRFSKGANQSKVQAVLFLQNGYDFRPKKINH